MTWGVRQVARRTVACALLALASAAMACTSATPRPPPRPAATPTGPTTPAKQEPPALAPLGPTLESVALAAEALAPGMREAERGELALPATIHLPGTAANGCVRVVLGAPGPIAAALVADDGRLLDVARATTPTAIGARGPVCLKRNQSARVEVQGASGPVRYVVRVSP